MNTPPIIQISNSTLSINFNKLEPVSFSIYVYDKDNGDAVKFLYYIKGISNYTVSAKVNNTIATSLNLTILYFPTANDVPSIQ